MGGREEQSQKRQKEWEDEQQRILNGPNYHKFFDSVKEQRWKRVQELEKEQWRVLNDPNYHKRRDSMAMVFLVASFLAIAFTLGVLLVVIWNR